MTSDDSAKKENTGITRATTAALILEKAINQALKYDPASRKKLSRFAGKIIQISFLSSNTNQSRFSFLSEFSLFISARQNEDENNNAIEIHTFYEGKPDATLSGSLQDFAQLAAQSTHFFSNTGIHVSGNSGLLSEFQDFIKELDIDWEAPITQIFGNIVGHGIAQTLRSTFSFANQQRQSFERYAADFLSEELQLIPHKLELENFYSDVDDLRMHASRLEAKIQLLQKKLAQKTP